MSKYLGGRQAGISKYLTGRQLAGLSKLGDVLIPGTDILPLFSRTEALKSVDSVLDWASESDRKGLAGIFQFLSWLPRWAIGVFLSILERDRWFPGFLGGTLRLLKIGLKGVVFSLYYSEAEIRKNIGWNTQMLEGNNE